MDFRVTTVKPRQTEEHGGQRLPLLAHRVVSQSSAFGELREWDARTSVGEGPEKRTLARPYAGVGAVTEPRDSATA